MNMIFFVPNVSETPLKSEGLKLRKKKNADGGSPTKHNGR